MKKSFLASLFLGLVFVFVLACGGGGGGDSGPTTNQDPDGFWTGTFTESGVGTYDLGAIIINGEIIAYSEGAGVLYRGNHTISGANLSANVNCYEDGGGLFASSVISGTVAEKQSIQANFTTTYIPSGSKTTGTITLNYDALYDTPSSLSFFEGDWVSADSWVTFDANGIGSGGNTSGCVFNGVVSLIDSTKNLYDVEIDVGNCGVFNGSYTGYQFFYNVDTFGIWVSNQNYIVVDILIRQ